MNSKNIPKNLLENWTVLVVDDHPVSLEVAADLLTHYGAAVVTAANGEEGYTKAKELKPNLIITDISMPTMNGWQLMDALKKDTKTLDIPVIALTAHAMLGDREVAISKGFHNYITKPLDPFTFITKVVTLLEEIPEIASRLKK